MVWTREENGKGKNTEKILETRMEGKRGRGRPRTTWMGNVISVGKKRKKTLVEMNRIVNNRKEWRKFAEMDPTP